MKKKLGFLFFAAVLFQAGVSLAITATFDQGALLTRSIHAKITFNSSDMGKKKQIDFISKYFEPYLADNKMKVFDQKALDQNTIEVKFLVLDPGLVGYFTLDFGTDEIYKRVEKRAKCVFMYSVFKQFVFENLEQPNPQGFLSRTAFLEARQKAEELLKGTPEVSYVSKFFNMGCDKLIAL